VLEAAEACKRSTSCGLVWNSFQSARLSVHNPGSAPWPQRNSRCWSQHSSPALRCPLLPKVVVAAVLALVAAADPPLVARMGARQPQRRQPSREQGAFTIRPGRRSPRRRIRLHRPRHPRRWVARPGGGLAPPPTENRLAPPAQALAPLNSRSIRGPRRRADNRRWKPRSGSGQHRRRMFSGWRQPTVSRLITPWINRYERASLASQVRVATAP
jgi:hypothetical protein